MPVIERCYSCGLVDPGPEHRAHEPLLCDERAVAAVRGHDPRPLAARHRLPVQRLALSRRDRLIAFSIGFLPSTTALAIVLLMDAVI